MLPKGGLGVNPMPFLNLEDNHEKFDRFEGEQVKVHTITGQTYTGTFHLHGTWAEVTHSGGRTTTEVNLDHVAGIAKII